MRKKFIIKSELISFDKRKANGMKKTRNYSTLRTAIIGSMQWMLRDGFVKDVVVVYDIQTGLEIGTIKMTALGKIVTSWIWE